MTIDEALTQVDYAGPSDRRDTLPCTVVAAKILAAEVRRLRAAIERVKALDRYDCKDEYMALWPDGDWIDRADVLRILEATDGD